MFGYDIFEDLDILNKCFSNLRRVKLLTSPDLSLSQIGSICKKWKINLVKYGNSGEYSIASKAGCLVLYDGTDYCYISFNTFKLDSYLNSYTTQGDFVIFNYNNEAMDLEVD